MCALLVATYFVQYLYNQGFILGWRFGAQVHLHLSTNIKFERKRKKSHLKIFSAEDVLSVLGATNDIQEVYAKKYSQKTLNKGTLET